MSHSHGSGSNTVLVAFALGAVAGAAIALLYAPATGEETRRKLAEKAREGRDQANRAFERGKSAFDKARQAAGSASGSEDAL